MLPRKNVGRLRRSQDKRAAQIVIALYVDIILWFAAEIVGEQVIGERFAGVVLSPIDTVKIEVHEAAVGIQTAHVKQAVLDKTPGHVEAAVHHVLVAAT